VGAEFSVREAGRTDMTKLIFAFRNFVNACEKKRKILVEFLGSAQISVFVLMAVFWNELLFSLVCSNTHLEEHAAS